MRTLFGPTLGSPVGSTGGGGLGTISLPGIEQVLVVDKSSEVYVADGTQQLPFNSIQDAIDAAVALTPTTTNRILIYIYPGIYDEALTLNTDYIYLQGVNRESTIIQNTATVLTITADETAIWNLTIEATSADAVIIASGAMTKYVEFHDCCILKPANNTAFISVATGADLRFVCCDIVSGTGVTGFHAILLTDANTGNRLAFEDCQILGGFIRMIGGDLRVERCNCAAAGGVGSIWLNGAAVQDVFISQNSFFGEVAAAAKVYTSAAPAGDVVVKDNHFVGGANVPDLESTVAVTGWVIEGNVMEVGIAPEISHVAPTRYVGSAGMKDWYATTQDALDSCTFDDITVHLWKDEAVAALLRPPDFCVYIDGHGHTISRAGGVLTILSGECVITRRLNLTGKVVLAGTNGKLYLQNGSVLTGGVQFAVTASGAFEISDSEIIGSAVWQYPIQIDTNPGIDIVIKRSYLKGVSGSPAIYWTTGNDDIKIKFSTIEHGSLAGNNPFGRSAAQTPNFVSHHTGYNSDPEAVGIWTNLIAPGQRFDALDVGTDY